MLIELKYLLDQLDTLEDDTILTVETLAQMIRKSFEKAEEDFDNYDKGFFKID